MSFFKNILIGVVCFGFVMIGCADKAEVQQDNQTQCANYVNYASATFEIDGDMVSLVEKVAKKALTKSCLKKSDNSTANLRIKVTATQNLQTKSGFIKDTHNNTFNIAITAIMLVSTQEGGLTTLTSKQNASLNLKSELIADIGDKSELTEKEVGPFVEQNVLVAINNLIKDM